MGHVATAEQPQRVVLAQAVDDLHLQTRLARARIARHEREPRRPLLFDLLVEREERANLAITSDALRLASEERPHALGFDLAEQNRAVLVGREFEAPFDEIRREHVDAYAAGGVRVEQGTRAIDDVSERHRARDLTATRRDGESHRSVPDFFESQRGSCRAGSLIHGGSSFDDDYERPIEQDLRVRPERAGQRARSLGGIHLRPALLAVHEGRILEWRRASPSKEQAQELSLSRRERPGGRADRGVLLRRRIEPVEIARDVRRRRVACLLRFRQHARDDVLERCRDVRPQRAQRWRLLEQHLRQDGHRRVAVERASPAETLVQHAPEREHVGARVEQRFASGLLRCHVAGGSHHAAGLGQVLRPRARDSEIDELGCVRILAHEEHVRWLHVAVDDSDRVSCRER